MSRDFNVRYYQKGDEDKIIKLLEVSFPSWAKNKTKRDFWEWKYRDTPMKSEIVVANSEDKIIGAGHRINFNTKIGTLFHQFQLGDDFATHPDYRGMGVYNKIMDLIEINRLKNNQYLFSITYNQITINDQIKRGRFLFPHPVAHMTRVKDIDLHLKKKFPNNVGITKYGFSLLKILNKSKNIFSSNVSPIDKFEIIDTNKLDKNFDLFWEKVKEEYNFITEKNTRYLNWRYCDPRSGNCTLKLAVTDDQILGFIAIKLEEDECYIEGKVMDLLTISGRRDVWWALLKNSIDYFEDKGANAIHYKLMKNHPYSNLLCKNGFVDTSGSSDIHIIIDFNKVEKEYNILKFSPINQTYFSIGDCLF